MGMRVKAAPIFNVYSYLGCGLCLGPPRLLVKQTLYSLAFPIWQFPYPQPTFLVPPLRSCCSKATQQLEGNTLPKAFVTFQKASEADGPGITATQSLSVPCLLTAVGRHTTVESSALRL